MTKVVAQKLAFFPRDLLFLSIGEMFQFVVVLECRLIYWMGNMSQPGVRLYAIIT